jgi:hypothetical protein
MTSFKHPSASALRWLPVVAGLSLLAAGPAQGDEMRWTATSYLVQFDKDTGSYQRKGLAMFAGGEVVPLSIEGQMLSSEGGIQTSRLRIVYTFDDGSTLVQEGEGRSERVSPTRALQSGTGRLVAGTGRYAGISGTTTSKGLAVTPTDHYTEFKAEYMLPAR